MRSRSRVDWAVGAARRVRGGLVVAALKVDGLRRAALIYPPQDLQHGLIDAQGDEAAKKPRFVNETLACGVHRCTS